MAFVERIPYKGPLSIDLTPHKDIIFDLPQGALIRLAGEKEGIDGVIEELNIPWSLMRASSASPRKCLPGSTKTQPISEKSARP